MDKKKLEKLKVLIKEGLEGANDIEDLSMSDIDMPIQDKAVFSAMNNDEVEDDMSDIAKYRRDKNDSYEGGFQDDVSVSPGYFNEEELAEIIREGVEKLHRKNLIENRLQQINNELNIIAKYRRDKNDSYEGGIQDDAFVSPRYFNEEELDEIIREGVEKLHRKNLIENRLQQINNELNIMANPEAWETSRTETINQLKKKHAAWQDINTKVNLISEGATEKQIKIINNLIDKFGHRDAAKKIIDAVLKTNLMGMSSEDLSDTNIFADGLDTVEDFLKSGNYGNALNSAKETAHEMIEDEGNGMMF